MCSSVQYGLIRSDFGPLWYYSVQFGLLCSLNSNLVLFGPIQLYSIQFGHIRFYSVYSFYFSSIRSTFVLLGPIQFYWVNLVIFSQLCFYSVQFGHIRSNLVICSQLCFYSVQFSHIRSYSIGRVLRLHATISSRFHIPFDGLNDALSKIYLQPYVMHRSCPSHFANKRIQDPFPSKL